MHLRVGAALGRPANEAAARTTRPRSIALWLCLVALATAAPAALGDNLRVFPIVMRVEGYVGEKPERVKSLARWVIAVDDRQFLFHVTKLQPIGTDIAYWTILNALEPLPVTVTLYGDPQLIGQFSRTPPGQAIAITGNFEAGPGPVTLMLRSIEPLPQPANSTTPSAAPVMAPTEGSTPGS